MELKQDFLQELEPRLKKMAAVMLSVVILFVGRLYYLQGIRGNFYRMFSEENSIREISLPAARGMMFDRHGEILVDNRPSFDLVVIPQYMLDPKQVLKTLRDFLHIPEKLLLERWEKMKNEPPFRPFPILEDVGRDLVSWVRTHKSPWGKLAEEIDLRGVDIRLRYVRDYHDPDMASHVLGYVREIDAKHLKQHQKKWPGRYHRGDEVGIRGLEEVWDFTIRGEEGFQQRVVNAIGKEVSFSGLEGELIQKEAVHGPHLKLTLDAKLQKVARDFFKGKSGAAVALDPRDGAVLLLYSAPSFDLNRLSGRLDQDYWQQVATSPEKYLLNRAIQGAYPPGSVFKIVTGTAALHEGVVKMTDLFYCKGGLHFGNRFYHCWKEGGHGPVSFMRGLIASCDVYFYNLGLKVGIDRLAKYAKAFGLGSKTGIELRGERSGLMPSTEWKKKTYGEEWQEGETLSAAIGQGADLMTPLQGAILISTIANGGKKIRPYLVQSILDPQTGKEEPVERKPTQEDLEDKVQFSPDLLHIVYEALEGVVSNPEGTAHRLSSLGVPIAGKTGTAQLVTLGKGCSGELCRDHAWFVAFAPADNPQIAISVLVEHGGHGSSGAAPLAGELIKAYLEKGKDETSSSGKF